MPEQEDTPGASTNEEILSEELSCFFDQFEPTPYEPTNCHSESRLQEIATGKMEKDRHALECLHCSYIIANLEAARASGGNGSYRFMEEIRKRADAERKKPSHRASFWESTLARLRSDSGFRFSVVGATAAILFAIALIVPTIGPSRDTSVSVQMPVEDQGRYLVAMEKMKGLPNHNLSSAQLGAEVYEINKLIREINANNLSSPQRGELAEEIHDLSFTLRRGFGESDSSTNAHLELAVSADVDKVNDLHEALAKLGPGQIEDAQVDVKAISRDRVDIAGPFKHEQLLPGTPVYRVLANYASSQQTDVNVEGPTGNTLISASAFVPKH